MRTFSDHMTRVVVAIGFSRWATAGLAGVVGLVLLVMGASPRGSLFWIILAVAVLPFLLIDVVLSAFYARRGMRYAYVKREAARLTLEEMERRREAKRHAR
jgi:predicted lysophospholipase L1 biosynthesis ABC-type transport system permease subunit